MTYTEGTLQMQDSGRWALVPDGGGKPIEITSGDRFKVEVAGRQGLSPTRMEYTHYAGGGGAYYTIDGYPLANGLRAAIGGEG